LAALELRVQATNEKTQIIQIFMQKMSAPSGRRGGNPTVLELMNVNMPTTVNSALKSGYVGGGMNTLTKYRNLSGSHDFFKPNVNTIEHFESLDEADKFEQRNFTPIINSLMEVGGRLIQTPDDIRGLPNNVDDEVDFKEFGNRTNFANAFEAYQKRGVNTEFKARAGINLDNLKSSNREVAMSRLDMLLDANLISKANLAIEKNGLKATPRLGSVATEAKGKTIDKYQRVDNLAQHPGTNDTIRKDDPVLLSKLSALQLIDFLAGQVDRHQGNYYIQVDAQGRVINLTGIDNDMSFGTKDANQFITGGARQLPAIGVYFDADMANKIINLDPAMVRIALGDLLTREEIESTLQRLDVLKNRLQQAHAAGNLLNPNQWANMIATQRGNFKFGEYNLSAVNAN